MERDKVVSSNLASVGYDAKKEILEIEFKHGGIYQYYDVPYEIYGDLMNAESHGSYFFHNIRDVYEYVKL